MADIIYNVVKAKGIASEKIYEIVKKFKQDGEDVANVQIKNDGTVHFDSEYAQTWAVSQISKEHPDNEIDFMYFSEFDDDITVETWKNGENTSRSTITREFDDPDPNLF